jgi:hypothetical protein
MLRAPRYFLIVFFLAVLSKGYSEVAVWPKISVTQDSLDYDFLAKLSAAGIFDAAQKIGLDAGRYLKPLAKSVHHSYRRYRWSVGYHEDGGIMISALPPEEEVGWTPWERWYKDKNGVTRKESWVMYPLKNPAKGVSRWYKLDESELAPRYLTNPKALNDKLRLARIYEAAAIIGFDVETLLLKPLSLKDKEYYLNCRWVIVPHILAADGPVIYILPAMHQSANAPWESWYSDGKIKLIHHVHFTEKKQNTTGEWKEFPGAPQRPPEIFGVTWYWYDDKFLIPFNAHPE